MSAPSDPAIRPAGDGNRHDEFARGARVWVYSWGAWRPGIVLGGSDRAAVVRYRPTEGGGTAVDTVLPHNLAPRPDADTHEDHRAGLSLSA